MKNTNSKSAQTNTAQENFKGVAGLTVPCLFDPETNCYHVARVYYGRKGCKEPHCNKHPQKIAAFG